jgi:hypothetical protein
MADFAGRFRRFNYLQLRAFLAVTAFSMLTSTCVFATQELIPDAGTNGKNPKPNEKPLSRPIGEIDLKFVSDIPVPRRETPTETTNANQRERVRVSKDVNLTTPEIVISNPLFHQPKLESFGLSAYPGAQSIPSGALFFVDAFALPFRVITRQNRRMESTEIWNQSKACLDR